MGNHLFSVFNRLFDYPLKRSRPCAFEPEIPQEGNSNADFESQEQSNYDKVVNEFEEKLIQKRIENLSGIDGKTWEEKKFSANFPDWSESTISYLHSLFLTFCNEDNKMIDFKAFSCILMCLYHDSEAGKRRERFNLTDSNQDGFIEYSEFLELIYKYDNLGLLAKIVSEKTNFIEDLSIGQQLEHGLF